LCFTHNRMKETQFDAEVIAELFDAQPDSVVWFKPVFSVSDQPHIPIDFELAYCNQGAADFSQTSKEAMLASTLFNNTVLDNSSNELIFQQCREVYTTGKPIELTYYNHHFKRYFNVVRSKIKDGVLSISRDRTDQFIAEQKLKQQAEKYNAIIQTSADGILILEAVRSADNEIVDFIISHCNQVGCSLGHLKADAVGTRLLDTLPHLKLSEQFEMHKRVIETGEPVQFETSFRDEDGQEYGWFIVTLMKLDDSVLSRFVDVSQKKSDAEQIERQANLLKSVLDASLNGVFALEAIRDENGNVKDFTFITINKEVEKLLGRKEEDIIGKSYLSILPNSRENGAFDLKRSVLETGQSVQLEKYTKGDGIDGWFNLSIAKLGDNGVVQSFSDVTESKHDKNKLSTIFNTAKAGMFTIKPVTDEHGEVIDFVFGIVNQAVATYIGETAEKLEHSLASIYFPAYKENGLFDIYLDTFQNNKSHQFDFHYEHGYDVYFNIHTTRVDEEVLVTFTDQTSLKKLQYELEKSVEDLKRSNANLEEFAYAASHDLQEPLRKINVFSLRLRKELAEDLSEDNRRIFERMESAAKRMSQLIEDLLAYSQLSTKVSVFKEIDLNELMEQVTAEFEETMHEKNIVLNYKKLPVVSGDGTQLRQAFHNLVSNAIKYSGTDYSPIIKITSELAREDGSTTSRNYHKIVVEDNGIGFDQEHAERIFKVFHRLHGRSEYPGTGIGLAIVQRVITNHEGTIWAESEPGKGARFIMMLPA
jgi:signal transduction histidine kinase/PAS domain-containing protein